MMVVVSGDCDGDDGDDRVRVVVVEMVVKRGGLWERWPISDL